MSATSQRVIELATKAHFRRVWVNRVDLRAGDIGWQFQEANDPVSDNPKTDGLIFTISDLETPRARAKVEALVEYVTLAPELARNLERAEAALPHPLVNKNSRYPVGLTIGGAEHRLTVESALAIVMDVRRQIDDLLRTS